jgi:predicted DCC family thiol-disulfide oxidoreductase YuxK
MPSPIPANPPGKYLVLFDGHCRFCTVQLKKLLALARPGVVEGVDFQEPGVLDHFPGLTYDACMQAMHLVKPDGRVYRGFEAAVQAVATRPVLGWLAYIYYVPGLRQLCDLIYRQIAAHRYRLMGKMVDAGACENGTCSLHAPARRRV